MGQALPWVEKASLGSLAALQNEEPQKNIEIAVPSPPGSSGHTITHSEIGQLNQQISQKLRWFEVPQ